MSRKKSKRSAGDEPRPPYAITEDSYHRSVMTSPAERRAQEQRAAELGLHKHFYDIIWGHGVFYYKCRTCPDAVGYILDPEVKTAV